MLIFVNIPVVYNLLISPINLVDSSTTIKRKVNISMQCDALLLSFSVLLFLPAHSTWLLKCTVRRSRRKWDRQPKRVKQTVQAFSNPFLEHYSNLYISKGIYKQQNWEYQEKWTQHIYAPSFLLGGKAKWKGRWRAMLWQKMQAVPIALGNILRRFLKLSAAEITSNGGRGVKAILLDSQITLLIEIVVVY